MELIQPLIDDVKGAFSAGAGGYILLALYAFAAIVVLVGLLKGWSRGLYRSMTRIVTVGLSMLLSLFVCLKLYPYVAVRFEGRTLLSVLQQLHLDKLIAGNDVLTSVVGGLEGEALSLLLVLGFAVVILPVTMVLVFVIGKGLLRLVHAIVCHIFGWDPYCNNMLTRFLGALVGLVQSVFVVLFLFIPLFNMTSYVGAVSAELPASSEVSRTYDRFVRPSDESGLAKLVRTCGGDSIKRAFAGRLTVNGEKTDVDALVTSLGSMVGHAQMLDGADFKNLTDDQIYAIRTIIAQAKENEDTRTLLTALVRTSASSLSEYESRLPFREPVLTTVDAFIAYFDADLTDEQLLEDVTTLSEAYIVLMDSGVLKAADATSALQALMREGNDGRRPLTVAVELLHSNERTAHLADSVMDSAIALIAQSTDLAADALYDKVSTELRVAVEAVQAQQITDAQLYEAALSTALTEMLQANDMAVSEDGAASMARCIATAHNDTDAWTAASLCAVWLSYFEAELPVTAS